MFRTISMQQLEQLLDGERTFTLLDVREQKEYEAIDDDIEELENRVSELDDEIAKNATSYSKLAELTKEKEDVERQLEEKMERWEYLNDLAEKIEKQKQ